MALPAIHGATELPNAEAAASRIVGAPVGAASGDTLLLALRLTALGESVIIRKKGEESNKPWTQISSKEGTGALEGTFLLFKLESWNSAVHGSEWEIVFSKSAASAGIISAYGSSPQPTVVGSSTWRQNSGTLNCFTNGLETAGREATIVTFNLYAILESGATPATGWTEDRDKENCGELLHKTAGFKGTLGETQVATLTNTIGAMTVSVALANAEVKSVEASAALTGEGTLTASVAGSTSQGAANLEGLGSLSASAIAEKAAAAALTGEGTLSVRAAILIGDRPVDPRPREVRYAAEVTFGDGSAPMMVGPDEGEAEDVLVSADFDTELPGGFGPGKFQIPRPEGLEETRARLFAGIRLYDADTGETYYRGRITAVSWASDTIDLESEGWSKHLEDDQTASEVFYDRDLSRWGGNSVKYRLARESEGYTVADASQTEDGEVPALEDGATGKWGASARPWSSGWYDAGSGNRIGYLDYAWKRNANLPNAAPWSWEVALSSDDHVTSSTGSGELRAAGPGSGTLSSGKGAGQSPYRYAKTKLAWTSAEEGGEANKKYSVQWTLLGVVGDHGLKLRGSVGTPDTGRGLYGSDVAAYAVKTWAPLLDYSTGLEGSIEPTEYKIPHLSFPDPTTARQMVETLSVLGGSTNEPLDWGVYERFFMRQPGTYGRTWRVRKDQTAESHDAGPSADERINGLVVVYDDGTGRKFTVGPPGSGADAETAKLEDADPTNPANQDGARHWRTFDAGITDQIGAIIIGVLLLTRANNIVWRGDVQINGQAFEDGGSWLPVELVRAGDYVIVEDDVDRRPRRIVNTTISDRSVTATCGTPPDRLDVLMAREAVGLLAPAPVAIGAGLHSADSKKKK